MHLRKFINNLFNKPTAPVYVSTRTLVTTLQQGGDTLSLWSDGSVSSANIDGYLKEYTGKKQLIHNFFFSDTPKVFAANITKEGSDNCAYNAAYLGSPFGQMLPDQPDAMIQAFAAVLVNGRFDPKTVKAIPDALAGRATIAMIPEIIHEWRLDAAAPFPLVQTNDWTVL